MIRLLIIFGILCLIGYVGWRLIQHSFRHALKTLLGTPNTPAQQSQDTEKLVQCATCQTFLPRARAIKGKDCYYCCEEHAKIAK